MGDKYAECCRTHGDIGENSTDGCQEFMGNPLLPLDCAVCGCHRNFHRKMVEYKMEVVYTKCQKVHGFTNRATEDGCQEFHPSGREGTEEALICAACGCHKAFHRNLASKPVTST